MSSKYRYCFQRQKYYTVSLQMTTFLFFAEGLHEMLYFYYYMVNARLTKKKS